jgi:hypothetical protein
MKQYVKSIIKGVIALAVQDSDRLVGGDAHIAPFSYNRSGV